jgi:hypothetical protein
MSEPREPIKRLEQTKDAIVDFFLASKGLDDATRVMWVSDAKEAYFQVVAAYQMAAGTSSDQEEHVRASKGFLASARSRMEQCSSELRAVGDEKAKELDSLLRAAFDESFSAISAELYSVSPGTQADAPAKVVERISDTEYALHCTECGKVAARFKVGPTWPSSKTGEMALLYEGTTKSTQFALADADAIFESLRSEKVAAVHSFMEEKVEGGLDAYCPTCDKVYCKEDYSVEEQWDAGFYDCSYGTCPEGHRRLLDD